MEPQIIRLDEVDSTNSWLKLYGNDLPHGSVVAGRSQTAGRGQRGNSWEAAPGMNITASVLLHPSAVKPSQQFAISEVIAIATAQTLRPLVAPFVPEIKWPNDIYIGNRKIAGILIENSLGQGSIDRSICGIGININQREFTSDAPNPVSVWQLTGAKTDIDTTIAALANRINELSDRYLTGEEENIHELHQLFCNMLWRRTGIHPYTDNLRHEQIEASIHSIGTDGTLSLRLTDGTVRRYLFKEVTAMSEPV